MTTAAIQLFALGLLAGWCALVLGAGVLLVRRWVALRGIGRSPMFSGSRATYPTAWDRAPLARLPVVSLRPTVGQGATGRVEGLGAQTRPVASDQACPDSRLGDKRAGGVPALRCARGEGGYSGEKRSFLQELTPQLPRPGFPELVTPSGGATEVCASRKGRGLCPSPACPATCAHVRRQSECGQVPDRASGHPHLYGVDGVLVHTGATGATFDRSFGLWGGMPL